MSTLDELPGRAVADLADVRRRISALAVADPRRVALESEADEIERLLADLRAERTSPRVVVAVASLQAQIHSRRRDAGRLRGGQAG